MTPEAISHLFITYRYWILIPIALVEGPVAAFVAGTLAAIGYFNVWLLAVIFLVRDLGMDALYYWIGFASRTSPVMQRLLKKFNVGDKEIEYLRSIWDRHPFRTMFIGKISYGIASAFVAAAGMVKVGLWKFFHYSVWITVIQFGGMLALGYFLGDAGGTLSGIVDRTQTTIAVASLVIIVYYGASWYVRKRYSKKA